MIGIQYTVEVPFWLMHSNEHNIKEPQLHYYYYNSVDGQRVFSAVINLLPQKIAVKIEYACSCSIYRHTKMDIKIIDMAFVYGRGVQGRCNATMTTSARKGQKRELYHTLLIRPYIWRMQMSVGYFVASYRCCCCCFHLMPFIYDTFSIALKWMVFVNRAPDDGKKPHTTKIHR